MQSQPQIIHKRMVRHNKRQAGADPFDPGNSTGEEDEGDTADPEPTTTATPRGTTTARPTTTAAAVTTRATTTQAQITTRPTTSNVVATTTEVEIEETTTAVVQTTAALTTTTPILLATSLRPTTATTLARITTSRPITTSASLTEEPTSTSTAEASKAPVGTIIGVIAGGLVGVVVVAATIGWLFRKWSRRKNEDASYRNDFMRNSVAIPDRDFAEKALKGTTTYGNPRPPSMIERHVNQVGTGAGAADNASIQQGDVFNAHSTQSYGGYPEQGQAGAYYNNGNGYDYNSYNNVGGAAAGYYDQSGHWVDYNQYPPQGAGYGYTPPNESQQSELTRRPSGPGKSTYLSRQPSNGAALNVNGSEQYSRNMEYIAPPGFEEKHQSVTPYQQQQYNEIHKQLGFDQYPNEKQDAAGQAGAANLGRALSTTYSSLNPEKPSPAAHVDQARSGTPTDPNPQQVYVPPSTSGNSLHPGAHAPVGPAGQNNRHSMFDADDAYGGM